jgi:hypothetical protein
MIKITSRNQKFLEMLKGDLTVWRKRKDEFILQSKITFCTQNSPAFSFIKLEVPVNWDQSGIRAVNEEQRVLREFLALLCRSCSITSTSTKWPAAFTIRITDLNPTIFVSSRIEPTRLLYESKERWPFSSLEE